MEPQDSPASLMEYEPVATPVPGGRLVLAWVIWLAGTAIAIVGVFLLAGFLYLARVSLDGPAHSLILLVFGLFFVAAGVGGHFSFYALTTTVRK